MKQLLIMFICLSSGCASSGIPCYAEIGIGTWITPPSVAEKEGLVGNTPTAIDLYCQKGNISAGWYHTSDIGRGAPFNEQEEWSSDILMIKYRKQIN